MLKNLTATRCVSPHGLPHKPENGPVRTHSVLHAVTHRTHAAACLYSVLHFDPHALAEMRLRNSREDVVELERDSERVRRCRNQDAYQAGVVDKPGAQIVWSMLPPLSRAAASLSSPSRPCLGFSVGVPAAPAPGSVAAPP
jgi:hypothetical protein